MSRSGELVPVEGGSLERFSGRMGPVLTIEAEQSGIPTDLTHYWHVVWKRRWTVVTVMFVVTTVVAIMNFRMKPVYKATVRVEVEAEAPQVPSLNDLYRGGTSDEAFVRTQVQVLESESLAWETIQQLGLAENSELGPSGKGLTPSVELQTRLTGAFQSRLSVEWIKNSRIVEVSYESGDPRLAAVIANALVNNYTEYNFRKRYNATRQASAWMEQQLDELKAKVEQSQQALVDYERKNAIINVGGQQSVEDQRLAQLSTEFTNAQAQRLEKEVLYEMVSSNEAQVTFVAQSEVLGRLEEKQADLKGQLSDALSQYGPNYPKVLRLKEQAAEVQSLVEKERKRIVARIRNDYMAASAREKLSASALAQEKEQVGRINQLLIEHNLLKREFEASQQLYDNLLQHLKDATLSAGLRATNIHVVDPALPPTYPVRPKKRQNILMGFVGSLGLGILIAFFSEILDNSVKSPEDIENLVAVPTLAVISKAVPAPAQASWLGRFREKDKDTGETEALDARPRVELTVVKQPASPMAESYRTLRTSILLSTPGHPPQVLLVTSGQPNEGKTCTSLNLAITLAQRGGRVAFIDADLRKRSAADLLGLSNGKGLSSILTGGHSLDEVIQQFEPVANLWVLPGGPRPPNPADLLSSPGMKDVLTQLRKRFDHVVVDSPPVLLVTDATILSTLVDGILIVVESGVTVRRAFVQSSKVLQSAGGRILGVVINKMPSRRDGYYGSYYGGQYDGYYAAEEEETSVKS